jgi:hypothetical protein
MAKKSKLNLINDDLTWNADRRYKVNSVVQLNGEDYQNITGKNSNPELLIDWQKIYTDIAISDVTGLPTALDDLQLNKEDKANKNIANGYAGLDSSGKINPIQLPALAITETFVVGSESAMLSLVAEIGDVAVRTDLNKSFILRVTGASTLANWQELLSPTSVDQTIIDGSTSAVSGNAVFDGLVLKAPLASPALTGTPTAPTATAGTNTTQIATTAFVTSAISTADSGNVKLTGAQTITGVKNFSEYIGLSVDNGFTSGGAGAVIVKRGGEHFAFMSAPITGFSGQARLNTKLITPANPKTFTFPDQDGTFALTNNPTPLTATSFIKSSSPATNILLAGGGDVAQSTFQPAITGLTTNYLPKWNGSGFGNSSIFDNGGTDISIINSLYSEFSIKGNQSLDNGGGQINFSNQTKRFASISGETESPNNGFLIFRNLRAGVLRESLRIISNGRILINKTDDDLTNQLQVAGTISASSYTATSLPVFENNAAASSLSVGQFYRTSIGVLMVKF